MLKGKAWRIIPRPLMETVLNNHVQRHRVHQPLILHGPRGVGKTTLILERLFEKWNTGCHLAGYVDFAEAVENYHPKHGNSYPWTSWTTCPQPKLVTMKAQLEQCLESMTNRAIGLGIISSHQVYSTLTRMHSPTTALRQILNVDSTSKVRTVNKRNKISLMNLWDSAVFKFSAGLSKHELDGILDKRITVEEESYYKEAMAALKLAKEVFRVQGKWKENAIQNLNKKGGFSQSLANSATDWPCLLIELLAMAAEVDYFQPKLVMNNIELLKRAVLEDDRSICGAMYHDNLIWRIIHLGVIDKCFPVILVTSDSYYSYNAFLDYDHPNVFLSREEFGWTRAQAKMHMVDNYFSQSEWKVVVEALGPNPRHLFEVYALKQNSHHQKAMNNEVIIEDIVDLYLAHLQVTAVNPAMEKALLLLEQFAVDVHNGKISKYRLVFGLPWRHPPKDDVRSWAKIQLMDFVQSLVAAEFGVNYLSDYSFEYFDDPAALALIEVGLLYTQRDPPVVRPVSIAIQRCIVRWLVQECMALSLKDSIQFRWHRIIRGRNYRHLLVQDQ